MIMTADLDRPVACVRDRKRDGHPILVQDNRARCWKSCARKRRTDMIPGETFPASGTIVLNKDRMAISLTVANTGDRPIQVCSHYHFAETNAALAFDPRA